MRRRPWRIHSGVRLNLWRRRASRTFGLPPAAFEPQATGMDRARAGSSVSPAPGFGQSELENDPSRRPFRRWIGSDGISDKRGSSSQSNLEWPGAAGELEQVTRMAEADRGMAASCSRRCWTCSGKRQIAVHVLRGPDDACCSRPGGQIGVRDARNDGGRRNYSGGRVEDGGVNEERSLRVLRLAGALRGYSGLRSVRRRRRATRASVLGASLVAPDCSGCSRRDSPAGGAMKRLVQIGQSRTVDIGRSQRWPRQHGGEPSILGSAQHCTCRSTAKHPGHFALRVQ